MGNIRNFSIIAHIGHGKSTLVNHIIQSRDELSDRETEAQVLDSMDIEKERGITIKAQTATLFCKAQDGKVYNLNLIDTPGRVDFSYEVSRSLSACEDALLMVDASQSVEVQTVASCYTTVELDVEMVPVLSKIDLPIADPESAVQEIEDVTGIDATDVTRCSVKAGVGMADALEALIAKVPTLEGDPAAPLQALIIYSQFDNYVGAVMLVRVVNGTLRARDRALLMATGAQHLVERTDVFSPKSVPRESPSAGQVGFVIAGIKEPEAAKIGNAIIHTAPHKADAPLPDSKGVRPQVFVGLHPVEANRYETLHESLKKLKLNDASLQYEPGVSWVLSFGFRYGFLSLLHMEIVQEHLEREFDMDLITTAPTVVYQAQLRDDTMVQVENPAEMPTDPSKIEVILEPIVTANLYMPQEYVGVVITLCEQRRGSQINISYHGRQVQLTYGIPMGEIMLDFFDRLKSVSRGYASMDYEFKGYRVSDTVRVDVLINGDKVDALSIIIHRSNDTYRGREVATKMCEIIPRQVYDVTIQAAIDANVIARENVEASCKNVLAGCYGGDISRKKKLLEKQKEGKKRMKQVGTVEIPQEAFLAILRIEEE